MRLIVTGSRDKHAHTNTKQDKKLVGITTLFRSLVMLLLKKISL